MKRLISQCRKSPFVKRLASRDNLPFTLAFAAMIVAVSCQMNHRYETRESVDANAPTTASTLAADEPSTPSETIADETGIKLVSSKEHHLLATFIGDTCDTAAPRINIKLQSIFGTDLIRVSFDEPQTAGIVTAEIGGAVVNLPAPAGFAASLKARACAASDATEIALEQDSTDKLHEIVERIAPDCERIQATATGLRCDLPVAEPDAARMELAGIQTAMIKRWSRQPYLLARRLAIGVTLAQTLQAENITKGLDTFCKLVASALPAELPATIASKRWQRVACNEDIEIRTSAALFALAKTVSEIDVMRQLFERTSRLGHLQVRIPNTEASQRRILINLSPEKDVADNLARETARLYLPDQATGTAAEETAHACWHPLYSESPELFALAQQLTLTGDGDQVTCAKGAQTPASNPAFAPQRYFAESITSETEFVVTNGHAKTLRLPSGHYTYTLRVLPDDPSTWDDASQVPPRARGTIAWDAKRPRAAITEW